MYEYNLTGIDEIIEEKGNAFIALREVAWGTGQSKLEIRKWYTDANGNETPNKGVTFMTEEGPNQLVNAMTGLGYGDTQEVLKNLSTREDFRPSLNNVLNNPNDEFHDNTVIPQDLYVPGGNLFEYDEE